MNLYSVTVYIEEANCRKQCIIYVITWIYIVI